MILGQIKEADRYLNINPHFAKALAFLAQDGLAELAPGRHEIDGDNVYAMVIKGTGQTRSKAKLEVHRKYIDVQYVISGSDDMGWKDLKACKDSLGPYDPQDDAELFGDAPSTWVSVGPGDFAIFFPEDAHAPGASENDFHKVVVKVVV